jgi:hypothetical protein
MIQKSLPLIFLLFSINGFSQTIIKKQLLLIIQTPQEK